MALPDSILIVGGGVFGLSTALSLSERHPTKQITLLEASPTIPNPHGSSVDSSRIIRADYANPAYAALAASAIRKWRTTEWGHEGRYTENGLVLVYSEGNDVAEKYTRDSYENVKRLEEEEEGRGGGMGNKVTYLPSKAAVEETVPRYAAGMNVAGGYLNRGSGWGDAEAGVRYAKQKLDQRGSVTIRHGEEVVKLVFADAEDNKVTGVIVSKGDETTQITADLIILATGAWTPGLIDLRGIAQATGQVLAYIKITDEEQEQLAHMPTILSFATGMFIIPPRNNELKIARHAYGYWNPKPVRLLGSKDDDETTILVSVPENGVPVPPEGENACRQALREMLPAFANRPFIRTRVCWYTDTPHGDFLITYHPKYPNLFLATGGSGHGYKFFPILGDKIVDALEGNLDPELKRLWAWPETQPSLAPVVTKDGSRSGAIGLNLMEELAKSNKEGLKL